MFDAIDPRSPTPLYEQIAARIRLAVASEELQPGEPLPSVRQLAALVRVNPATVVQAYRDLEAEGFVSMRRGAGTFVNEVPVTGKNEEMEQQARELVSTLMGDAARLGISAGLLREALSGELCNGSQK
jgi:GntR family transcriptional regulator